MKGLIWNSDGFGDHAKHIAVNEFIKKHKLDFVALLETGRASFSTHFLNFLDGGRNYTVYPRMVDPEEC